jgi:hypothetical protein
MRQSTQKHGEILQGFEQQLDNKSQNSCNIKVIPTKKAVNHRMVNERCL